MEQPKPIEPLGEAFAKAVVAGDWAGIYPLLSESARAGFPANASKKLFQDKFSWDRLEPLLRAAWGAETGENDDGIRMDPPARFEVFESEGRHEYSPEPIHRIGLTAPVSSQKVRWLMVNFLPAADSGFDHCYRCYLSIVNDFGQYKIAGAIVENIVD